MSTAQAKGEGALVTRTAIEEAYETIRDSVTHTPLQFDRYLSEKYDCQVYLKREDLQKVRSFKLRGAYYAIKNRPFREVARGVVCASAGNHAQGGGLISGIATYVKATSPTTKILGVEPTGAQSMRRALDEGHPVHLPTIDKFVDGAAVQEVGTLTFSHTQAYVDHMYAVDEGQVCTTILELYSKQAIVAEPAGALTVAVLDQLKEKIKGKTIVCVISGGNNDISRMEEIDERSLIYQGLKHYFLVNFPQRPGALREFVTDILGPEDDITRFEYTKKVNRGTGPVVIGIQLKQREAIHPLRQNIARFDPNFIDLSENQSLYTLLV